MDIRKPIVSSKAAFGKFSLPKAALDNLDKQKRKQAVFSALVLGNLALLILVGAFLAINKSTSQTVRDSLSNSLASTTSSQAVPLDQLSSAQIALAVAQQARLPEVTSVRNTADSEVLLLATVPNDSTILSNPQIVTTKQKSRYQIIQYKVRPGDSVGSIADKFRLTAGSITGSNNLTGDYVASGTTLVIPPATGIVYKVKSGDTVNSIVNVYGANKNLFISVNDAENGVRTGDYVWIPNVGVPGNQFNSAAVYSSYYAFNSFSPSYGFNGYAYGFCTWYVAAKVAIPTNWGNANTWDDYARITPGWTVSIAPRVGAIAQTDGMSYLGHAGVVEAVSKDRSKIKYSDMNGIAGFAAVGYSGWVPSSTFPHYIYR